MIGISGVNFFRSLKIMLFAAKSALVTGDPSFLSCLFSSLLAYTSIIADEDFITVSSKEDKILSINFLETCISLI